MTVKKTWNYSSRVSGSSTRRVIRLGKIGSFTGVKNRDSLILDVARKNRVNPEVVRKLTDEFFDGEEGVFEKFRSHIPFKVKYLGCFIPELSLEERKRKRKRSRYKEVNKKYNHRLRHAIKKIHIVNDYRGRHGLRPLDPIEDAALLCRIPDLMTKQVDGQVRSYLFIPKQKHKLRAEALKPLKIYKPSFKTKFLTEMKAKQSGSFTPIELPKPTTTVARCYSVIDIGTVPEFYENKPVGKKPKVFITWELPEFKAVFNPDKGEEPFVISKEFTLSTNDNSNLAKLVAQWRNKPLDAKEQEEFDPGVMIDKTCMISFIVRTKTKFKGQDIKVATNENSSMILNGIMPRPNQIPKPPALNPAFRFDWDEPFDVEKFDKIPKFLKEKIMTSDEWAALDEAKQKEVKAKIEASQEEAPSPTAGAELTEDDW